MRKRTLADYTLATLAVGIMIGFPVWQWIHTLRVPAEQVSLPIARSVARSQ
jgi:hypothetical protein